MVTSAALRTSSPTETNLSGSFLGALRQHARGDSLKVMRDGDSAAGRVREWLRPHHKYARRCHSNLSWR